MGAFSRRQSDDWIGARSQVKRLLPIAALGDLAPHFGPSEDGSSSREASNPELRRRHKKCVFFEMGHRIRPNACMSANARLESTACWRLA